MSGKTRVQFPFFSQEELREAGLTMKVALEAVEQTFRLYGEGKVILPDKMILDLNEKERGRINGLCAYVGGDMDLCGLKWIASFPHNPAAYGLPRATALLILNDSWKGVPLAVMDGTLISALRTGAVAGISAKYLAKKDSVVAALIGTSVIARSSACALKETLPHVTEMRVYSIDPSEKRERFASELSDELKRSVMSVDTPEKAVKGADVIVTATTADERIVRNQWVGRGTLFVHLGSYQEEDYETITSSNKIVVDSWDAVKHRGTPVLAKMHREGIIRDEDIYAEIAEIVCGKKKGREYADERIFCLPIGLGMLDIGLAGRVYKMAIARGFGHPLKLWETPDRYSA